MNLSDFFALTEYLPGQTPLFGQIGEDRQKIVPLSQLVFTSNANEIALLAGKKALTLSQFQSRLSQTSPKTKILCQANPKMKPQPLLGFHQIEDGRLVLQ